MKFPKIISKKKNNSKKINGNFNKEWPDHIITLDEKNFKSFIEKYPLSIVDFWASWCMPCKTMAPRLRRLSKIYFGKVAFGKIDIQKNKKIAEKFSITNIPNLIFFSNGKKIIDIAGVRSVGQMKKTIDELIDKSKR